MATPITPHEYDVGDAPWTTVLFKVHGVLSDPTTVTLQIKPPTGAVVVKTWADGDVTRLSLGTFAYQFTLSAAGSWTYRWEAAGAVRGAAERRMQVRPSEF